MKRKTTKLTAFAAALALMFGAFAAGVYAHSNGWLTFTGDAAIEESSGHVDEIMSILRQVNADKLTAEEALAELQTLNPPGLVKQIKALEAELVEANEYIAHLESELIRANQKVSEHNGKTQDALNEAREIVGEGGE